MKPDDPVASYRQHLVLAEQKAQEDFDKTTISLSGGALGISFAFLDNIVGVGPATGHWILVCAWLSWSASVAAILVSYFFSLCALRKAITQVDEEVFVRKPGGWFATVTDYCNVIGGILFIVGVCLMVWFVRANLGG